jgi:DNA-directed RNA polymerase specialized sigma subunit
MSEDFNSKVSEFVEKASKSIEEGGKTLLSRLDIERQKAEIRAEIGHTSRELTKAYEKLGRAFFDSKESGKAFKDDYNTIELIRSKERAIELLNEKLDQLEK